MHRRSPSNEFRVSLRYPGGTRTSKKFSHLTAGVRFLNKMLENTSASLVIEKRECGPWTELPLPIPPDRKWNR